MVRCFVDDDVTHVAGAIDPIADIETIETELMLADLDSLERRVDGLAKKAKGNDKDAAEAKADARSRQPRAGAAARRQAGAAASSASRRRRRRFRMLGLLTSKPVLYVCNVDEAAAATGNALTRKVEARAQGGGRARASSSRPRSKPRSRCCRRPSAPSISPPSGSTEPGLDRLIRAGYALLDLITYFTAGPKEAAAWTITRGTKAPQAAGVIHSDFERGFIRAETIAYDDYVTFGGETGARDAGKMRLEGKDYVVADGDVMHFRFAT